jgi:hypothetical protein
MEPRPSTIDLPRGASETFSDDDEACTKLRVPSCRPTPLIGSWADESWPLNSRQASELIAEQAFQRQQSSTYFEVDETEGHAEFGEQDLHSPEASESLMQEAMSHAQPSTEEVVDSPVIDSPTHVARCYTYDPYNVYDSYNVIYCCTCESCAVMLREKEKESSSGSDEEVDEAELMRRLTPPAPIEKKTIVFAAEPLAVCHPEEPDWDSPLLSQSKAVGPQVFPEAPAHRGGFVTHTTVSPSYYPEHSTPSSSPSALQGTPSSTISGLSHPPPTIRRQLPVGQAVVQETREVTPFMPPPPPPRIATMVMKEEGTFNPSGVYYHLIMRWYSRVQVAQEYFIAPEVYCPQPNRDKFTFEQWCDEVSGWWYTHFEQMQKKVIKFPRFTR